MVEEAYRRYSTAKEYVEAIKLILSSPHHRGQHAMMAIRPSHLLAGFAVELYLKAWLLADGRPSDAVQKQGHRLLDLYGSALARGFTNDARIRKLVENLAEPHGQNRDHVFRYSQASSEIKPLIWTSVLPIFDALDVVVDTHVGASASHGPKPGH